MTREEKEKLLSSIDTLSTRFCTPSFGGTVIDTITLKKIIDDMPLTYEKPKELYAILDIRTDKIIFNARGGCYHKKEDAERKRRQLISEDFFEDESAYKVVVYKLHE